MQCLCYTQRCNTAEDLTGVRLSTWYCTESSVEIQALPQELHTAVGAEAGATFRVRACCDAFPGGICA